METIQAVGKRLHIILDVVSFAILLRIKQRHRDASFTAAIKRAIALTAAIDELLVPGAFLLLRDPVSGKVRQVILP